MEPAASPELRTARYSFVVPIYGDGASSAAFCEEIQRVFQAWLRADSIDDRLEVIFVNDGSRNASQGKLEETAARFPFARAIELSRNFGQHVALSCGYLQATGDFVGSLNVDMQDPPDQIPVLVEAMAAAGADIAVGMRQDRQDSILTKSTSAGFYKVLNSLTGANIPANMATLRVMSRRFVDAFNMLEESTPFIPALEQWIGFKRIYVETRHVARTEGKSTYTFWKRLKMAWNAVISFSDLPIRVAASIGAILTLIGLALSGTLVVLKLMGVPRAPGYTSTVAISVLLGGLQLLFLGLIALYVGRIWREVQGRPRFVIRSMTPQRAKRRREEAA